MKMESSEKKVTEFLPGLLVLCALHAGFIRSLPDILKSTHDHKYEQMLVFGEMVIMFIRRCESTALLSDISHTVYAERLDVHKSYLNFPLNIFKPIATYRSYDVPNSRGLLKSKKLFVTARPYFTCWAPSHGGYNTFKLIDNTLKHKSVPLEWQRWKCWNFGNIMLTRKCQYWRMIWHEGRG